MFNTPELVEACVARAKLGGTNDIVEVALGTLGNLALAAENAVSLSVDSSLVETCTRQTSDGCIKAAVAILLNFSSFPGSRDRVDTPAVTAFLTKTLRSNDDDTARRAAKALANLVAAFGASMQALIEKELRGSASATSASAMAAASPVPAPSPTLHTPNTVEEIEAVLSRVNLGASLDAVMEKIKVANYADADGVRVIATSSAQDIADVLSLPKPVALKLKRALADFAPKE